MNAHFYAKDGKRMQIGGFQSRVAALQGRELNPL